MKTAHVPPDAIEGPPAVRRRRALIMLIAALLLITSAVSVFHKTLFYNFAIMFRHNDVLKDSDAIVILLGKAFDRTATAAELYRKGLAPVILMGPTEESSDEADHHREILANAGVPSHAIRTLTGEAVKSTHDEALRVRDFVRAHRLRRITVVTTAFHTARTRWVFLRVLRGTGVDVRMVASSQDIDESNFQDSYQGINLYLTESIKFLYYKIVY